MKTKHQLLCASLLFSGYAFALPATTNQDATTVANDTIENVYYELDDVIVSADKPIVQSDGAKLTYNLQEDPSAKGNTLLDALRKVPMVTIDGDNKIRINGQDNFKIYVNGKEEPSLTANYKNIFRAMPAESVVKIEVITEPGAKYDAEGTAGILNLITIQKNSTDGYSGNLTANFSKTNSGGSVYGMMKRNRLSMSANIQYANGSLFPQKNENHMETENLGTESARYQNMLLHQEVKFKYLGGGLNLSYDLSDHDLLTANADIYSVNGSLDNSNIATSTYSASKEQTSYLFRDVDAAIRNTGVTASASWQHDFGDSGKKTILSYQYNHGYNRLWLDFMLVEQSGMSDTSPFERQDPKEFSNEHTVQFDYVNPFNDNHTLEAGAKAIIRRNHAYTYLYYGDNASDAVESMTDRTDLIQKQDVYAAYLSYTGKFGNLSANAGLRYEHTDMGIDFKWGEMDDFTNRLNDLVPNAALTYSFTPSSNVRIAYQMRISRPGINQVNPYLRIISPYLVETGNPDLGSEKANKITLTYTNFGPTVGGNIGIEYSAIDNAISQYYYAVGDQTYQTYANIGNDRSLAAFGFLNWTIIQRMQLSVNARLTRQMFSAPSMDAKNAGWSLNYGANWSYATATGFKFNAYGGQTTRNYDLQAFSNGWYYYGVGISKELLKDKSLTLTVNASNFLQSHTVNKSIVETPTLKSESRFTNRNWNVGVTVSWNFGNLKGDVKKTSVKINNDDKSSIGGKSQGGI